MQITAEALGVSDASFGKMDNTRIRDLGANPTLFLFILEEKKGDNREAPKGAGKTPFPRGERVTMPSEGCGRRELALPKGATKGVGSPLGAAGALLPCPSELRADSGTPAPLGRRP